jgi:iron complex transport system substrate-binding protein
MSGLLSRRAVVGSVAAAVAGATSLKVAAAQSTPGASPAASPAASAFPVTLDHVYGQTVIESKPERVVTIGWSTQDAVIALGVIPVAIPRNDWGGDADGFFEWTREAIGDAELPAVLDFVDGVPFEDIIAASPDVVLAPYSGITQEEYDTLSSIAPTVAFKETPWSSTWQEVTEVTGKALGLEAEAAQLIADTDAYVTEQASAYPELAGKSFVYGNMGDGSTAFNIYTETDSRPLFLESIGLVPSAFTQDLEVDPANPYYVQLSYERANEIEGDIVVFWFGTQEEYETAAASSMLQGIPAFNEGRFAAIIGQPYVMATSAFSSLSIAFALEAFLPVLAAAAQNVA